MRDPHKSSIYHTSLHRMPVQLDQDAILPARRFSIPRFNFREHACGCVIATVREIDTGMPGAGGTCLRAYQPIAWVLCRKHSAITFQWIMCQLLRGANSWDDVNDINAEEDFWAFVDRHDCFGWPALHEFLEHPNYILAHTVDHSEAAVRLVFTVPPSSKRPWPCEICWECTKSEKGCTLIDSPLSLLSVPVLPFIPTDVVQAELQRAFLEEKTQRDSCQYHSLPLTEGHFWIFCESVLGRSDFNCSYTSCGCVLCKVEIHVSKSQLPVPEAHIDVFGTTWENYCVVEKTIPPEIKAHAWALCRKHSAETLEFHRHYAPQLTSEGFWKLAEENSYFGWKLLRDFVQNEHLAIAFERLTFPGAYDRFKPVLAELPSEGSGWTEAVKSEIEPLAETSVGQKGWKIPENWIYEILQNIAPIAPIMPPHMVFDAFLKAAASANIEVTFE